MTNKAEVQNIPVPADSLETASDSTPKDSGKKTFVEPELSHPIDVLEATTFFQSPDSGVSN